MTWTDDPVLANQLQWDGRTPCHFEAFDVSVLDPAGERGWWFRYTLDAPLDAEPHSTLWGAHFSGKRPEDRFALRTEFPSRAFAHQSDGFHIRVSKGELTRHSGKGGLRNPNDPGQSIRWNLQFSRQDEPMEIYPKKRMYKRSWPSERVLVPMPVSRAHGVVEVGDERFRVEDGYASQAHHWGTRHFDRWSSGLATGFRERPDALVYGLWAQPRADGRRFTVLRYRDASGRDLVFDEFSSRRSEPGDRTPGVWTFEAKGRKHTLSGRISASLQKMVGVTYDDPEGTKRYVHHSAVADATLELWRRRFGKPQLEETLTTKGSAVLQQGGQRAFDDVDFFL